MVADRSIKDIVVGPSRLMNMVVEEQVALVAPEAVHLQLAKVRE